MELFTEILTMLLMALIPASFSMLLDFCLGLPSDDINVKAIFFRWTYYLAKRKLEINGLWEGMYSDYLKVQKSLRDNNANPVELIEHEIQFKQLVVEMGKKLFTWEYATGMCIYCTNVYVALLFGVYFTKFFSSNVFLIPFIIVIFSHVILRKIKTH
jgi:hypothetical protein